MYVGVQTDSVQRDSACCSNQSLRRRRRTTAQEDIFHVKRIAKRGFIVQRITFPFPISLLQLEKLFLCSVYPRVALTTRRVLRPSLLINAYSASASSADFVIRTRASVYFAPALARECLSLLLMGEERGLPFEDRIWSRR